MQKEKKTAQELADMIQAEITVAGTFVRVPDPKRFIGQDHGTHDHPVELAPADDAFLTSLSS